LQTPQSKFWGVSLNPFVVKGKIKKEIKMTKKLEIGLPFFSGFYESFHSSVFEREEEYILEEYKGKTWDDFKWEYDYLSYCKNYVHAVNSILDLKLEFVELSSPREYNFSTDRIFCTISKKDLNKISTALDTEIMKDLVKRRFTSRDGFISSYSNDINEWKEKPLKDWDYNELGTLLEAWININSTKTSETEEFYDDIDYQAMEYCEGNDSYVSYTKKMG